VACAQIACAVLEALVRPRVHLPDPLFPDADAVIIGPGWGVTEENTDWLGAVLERCPCPVLLDADALTLLANCENWQGQLKASHVLTPHAGEWSRLLGRSFVPREEAAEIFARESSAVFLLKGPSTLVAARGHPLSWNSTGNAALATAGSGDVLAGVCGALLARKLTPYDAARLGAFVHGMSADLAVGLAGGARRALHLTAGDVIAYLQSAMARLEESV
jgi:NAD(P)H-hydrate epimerase